jgi:hypothetical protein
MNKGKAMNTPHALPMPPEQPIRQRGGQAANEPAAILVAPAPYVRVCLAALITGYTEKAIRRKIAEGVWREGEVWRKAPDGSILISIKGYTEWVATE